MNLSCYLEQNRIWYLLFEEETSYNDIDTYIQLHNQDRKTDTFIHKKDMLLPATLSFFTHPLILQVINNLVRDFLMRGRKEPGLFLLNRGSRIGFMPGTDYALTPMGPVFSIATYCSAGDIKYKLSAGHGLPWNIRYSEISLAAYGIRFSASSLSADVNLRVWGGEDFFLHDKNGNMQSSGKLGGMASVDLYYRVPIDPLKGRIPFIMGGVYLKTNGYTSGYDLTEGPGFRVGIGYCYQ